MQPFRLTLKNYRPFEDTAPVSIDVAPGITAFVGPNNSGKSSLLKFFYEFRDWFGYFTNLGFLQSIAARNTVGGSDIRGSDDRVEVFHNRNRRPLLIEMEFPRATDNQVSLVRLIAERPNPNAFTGEVFLGPNRRKAVGAHSEGGAHGFALEGATGLIVDASPLEETRKAIQQSLYIGPYRNAISEGGGNYFDVAIGTSFISVWNEWKTGASRQQNEAAQQATEDIAHIFGYKRLEINAAAGNGILQVIADGKPYRLRELGAGLAQFIVVFGNILVRQPSIVLIDEPELNLHPSLQVDFLLSLASYASTGVIFASHSIGLARSVAERLYTFRREYGRSIVKPFEQTINLAEFLGEMSFASYKDIGFATVLLVEGVTEVKAVQQFLRTFQRDHEIIVLPMGGDQFFAANREQELSELRRLTTNVGVLLDSERTSADQPPASHRIAFVECCERLGYRTCLTQRRAFENYLTDEAVKSVLGADARALGPYERLKDAPRPWSKSENWRIARAMNRPEIESTDIGRFIAELP